MVGTYQAFGNYYRFAVAEFASHEYKGKAVSLTLAGGVVTAVAGFEIAKWTQHWFASGLFTGAYLVQPRSLW